MPGFTENPFFFFVDNPYPAFPVSAYEDEAKIVELSDVGCDARLPVTAFSRKMDRRYDDRGRGPNDWHFCREDARASDGRFGQKRFRGHAGEGGNKYQRQWQAQSMYGNYVQDEVMPGRQSMQRNFVTSEKRPRTRRWDRRSNLYEQEGTIFDRNAEKLRKTSLSRNPYGLWTRMRRNDRRSSYDESKFPDVRGKSAERQNWTVNLETDDDVEELESSTDTNFSEIPEETGRIARDSSRGRSRCEKLYTIYNGSTDLNERSKENYKSSREYPREVFDHHDRTFENVQNNRIRSRTCSPPVDRRKRTKTLSKPYYENLESVQDPFAYQNFEDSSDNVDKGSLSGLSRHSLSNEILDSKKETRKYADRGVDTDDISDVLNICSKLLETHCLDKTKMTDKPGDSLKNAFWEFIPLNKVVDEVSLKRRENLRETERRMASSGSNNSHLETKNTLIEKHSRPNSRTKKIEAFGNEVSSQDFVRSVPLEESSSKVDVGRTEKLTHCLNAKSSVDSTSLLESRNVQSVESDRKERDYPRQKTESSLISPTARQPRKSSVESNSVELTSRSTERKASTSTIHGSLDFDFTPEVTGKSISTIENRSTIQNDPKDPGKFGSKQNPRPVQRSNRLLRRPNTATKPELACDKKKVADDALSVSTKNKTTNDMNFVEKTAACLKRKFNPEKVKGQVNEMSQCSVTREDKRIRSEGSKLPIRIGNRVRSKHPTATKSKTVDDDPIRVNQDEESQEIEGARPRTKEKGVDPKVQSNIPRIVRDERKKDTLEPSYKNYIQNRLNPLNHNNIHLHPTSRETEITFKPMKNNFQQNFGLLRSRN